MRPCGSFWVWLESEISEAIAWAIKKADEGAEVFAAPNGRKEGDGSKESVTTLTCLYADLDFYKTSFSRDQAIQAAKKAPIKPNFIIDSGYGIQLIWFIDPTTDKAGWLSAQRAIQRHFARFEADVAITSDESRVLRLPGFDNRKNGASKATRIIDVRLGRSTLADVCREFEIDLNDGSLIAKVSANKIPETIIQGSRNDLMMSLAGSMRHRGMSEGAITAALSYENERRCQPPLSDREVRAIARSAMRYESDDEASAVNDSIETINDLGKPVGRFMLVAFSTPEEMVTGLHRGEIGILQALPGIGKTSLALNLSICAASGKRFDPLIKASEPRVVIFFDFENTASVLQKDLSRMLSQLDSRERALLDKNLIIVVDAEIGDRPFKLSDPAHIKLATKLCLLHKADLVIIDTLAASFNMINENDNAEVNRVVIAPLQKLLRDCGAAGLVIHHIGKSGESDRAKVYRSRGASVLPAYARLVLDLSKDQSEENCVILNCTKIKGARFDDAVLKLDRDKRWFRRIGTKEPEQSTHQRVVEFLTHEMTMAQIKSQGSMELQLSAATIEREIKLALLRGEIEKTGHGRYAPKNDDVAPFDAEIAA